MMNDVMLSVDYIGRCNGRDSQRNITWSWLNKKSLNTKATQRAYIETPGRTKSVGNVMSKSKWDVRDHMGNGL